MEIFTLPAAPVAAALIRAAMAEGRLGFQNPALAGDGSAGGRCAYDYGTLKDGKRLACAVGVLLPVDVARRFDSEASNGNIATLFAHKWVCLEDGRLADYDLYRDVQNAHDDAVCASVRLHHYATGYRLSVPSEREEAADNLAQALAVFERRLSAMEDA